MPNRYRLHQTGIKPAHLLQATLILLVGVVFTFQLADFERRLTQDNSRTQLARTGVGLQSRLESLLHANMHLAQGLAATIKTLPDLDHQQLDLMAQELYRSGQYLKNIGLAPGNRLSSLYPLAGNESVLGLHYRDLPEQWPAVQAAIESRSSILAGPTNLVQGGRGLIYRTPIFLSDGSYWGLVSLVLDMDLLLHNAGLEPAPEGLRLAVFDRGRNDSENPVILGDTSLAGKEPVLLDLNIEGKDWQLALLPVSGWPAAEAVYHKLLLTGLLASLLCAGAHLFICSFITRLKDKDESMRAILDTTRDSIIVVDRHGVILEANRSTSDIFGYQGDELTGTPLSQLLIDDQSMLQKLFIGEALSGDETETCLELTGRHRKGDQFALEVSIGLMRIADRTQYVCVLRDITERKIVEESLIQLASTDPLTGAMNRRAFMTDGERLFSIALRFRRDLSVLALDADYFKKINDNFGHEAGDKVLVRMTEVLKSQLRRVDLISRFGGEEFIVLLPETSREKAYVVAEKLRIALAETRVETGDGVITFSCSIGLAGIESGAETLSELLQQADQALYTAKGAGRNQTRPAPGQQGSDVRFIHSAKKRAR